MKNKIEIIQETINQNIDFIEKVADDYATVEEDKYTHRMLVDAGIRALEKSLRAKTKLFNTMDLQNGRDVVNAVDKAYFQICLNDALSQYLTLYFEKLYKAKRIGKFSTNLVNLVSVNLLAYKEFNKYMQETLVKQYKKVSSIEKAIANENKQ